MQRSSKYPNTRVIPLTDFSGGLNFLVNPESIADNELQQAENWEYDYLTGSLKMVDGLTAMIDTGVDIDTLFYNTLGQYFIFSSGSALYRTDLKTTASVGQLNGTKRTQCCLFGNKVMIASGGKLQTYDGTTLTSIADSPNCDIVYEQFGRVGISCSGDDYLRWSGVGDETNWQFASIEAIDVPDNLTAALATGTLPAGAYTYVVTATNAFGETTISDSVSFTLASPGGVKLTWDAVEGATGYKIYGRQTGSYYLIGTVTSGDTLTWTDTIIVVIDDDDKETPPVVNSTEDAWTKDDAIYLEIGYKDGGDITAVIPLSQDIIVFKSSKKIFRVTNFYPNWAVYEVGRNIDCLNVSSALQAANDVYFLGYDGFLSLSTVVEYGSVKSAEAGAKINTYLVRNIDNGARIWHVPAKKQLWIKGQNDNVIMIYHYLTGAFTTRRTDGNIADIVQVDLNVYVAKGTKILKLDENATTDDGNTIRAYLKPKKFSSIYEFLVKKITVDVFNITDGYGTFELGDLTMPLLFDAGGVELYGCQDEIYENMTSLIAFPMTTTKKRSHYRTKYLDMTIIIENGSFSLRDIMIECGEV